MKRKTRKSASTAGKASLLRTRQSVIHKTKRKKKLKLKATNVDSVLNVVNTVENRMSKKKRKYPDDAMSSQKTSFSVENFSFGSCSTAATEPFHRPQTSRIPLVIDSPRNSLLQPAFSLTDLNFEVTDVEVPIPRLKKMKPNKRKCSTSASFEEVVSRQDNIQVFPIREWGLLIVVLPHPTTIKFIGPTLFQVISGSVKILGHEVEEFHGIVPVFSSKSIMCLDITTKNAEDICRQASRLQIVKTALLQNKVPENLADKILNSCNNSSVIVGFRKIFRSSDVHFASSLVTNTFLLKFRKNDFSSSGFKNFGFKISLENSSNLEYPQCEIFFHDVISSIKDSDEKGAPAPRIIIQGMKGLGKSTFLRYTINSVLNEFDAVYYLDGDPGQSEFSPAGCVSLTKVTAPIIGPPFTHQITPEKMYFLGGTAMQDSSDKYSSCMQLLIGYYKKNCSAIPLFVNTMGWIFGVGLNLLEELKSYILPTHVVKIVDDQLRSSHSRAGTPADPIYCSAKEFVYHRFATVDDTRQQMAATDRRNLSIIAYLGKCQKLYNSVCSIMSVAPYCVYWKDLALYVIDQKYATEHIVYALNGSWVALLSVDESLIMECDDPVLPKLLSVEPVMQDCYGFGVIAGIDIVKKAFYIITPEPEDRLKKINAIVKGNVLLPDVLYTRQDVKEEIPYVAEVIGQSNIASNCVHQRKFRQPKSETENH